MKTQIDCDKDEWVDKKLYWAWIGKGIKNDPPTVKRVLYATYTNTLPDGKELTRAIAYAVYDDNKKTYLKCEQVKSLIDRGVELTYPQGEEV